MKTRSLLHDAEQPSGRRRLRSRLVVLLALVASALGFAGMTAGSASAVGYAIAYSVNNGTDQTLYFESAVGPGERCSAIGYVTTCEKYQKNFVTQVSPKVVTPGNNIDVQSELNIFSFRQDDTIIVTYRIGATGNDKVVLYTDPYSAKCTVHGTKAYGCTVVPVGVGRDFLLHPVQDSTPHENPQHHQIPPIREACDFLARYHKKC